MAIVSTDQTYTFMASKNRHLTAVFERVPTNVVTVVVDPLGAGTATGGGTYKEGQSVTLTRTIADGYLFDGWYNAAGEQLSTLDTYTFTPTEDVTITAKFVAIPVYTITVAIDPEGAGTVTGAGQYKEGETVTLKAEPTDGQQLSKWTIDGAEVGTSETYTFSVTGDVEITAVFEKIGNVPVGYTELAYIESTGTQYIDTGISPIHIDNITIDASVGAQSASYLQLMGAYRLYYSSSSVRRAVDLHIHRNSNTYVIAFSKTATSSASTFPNLGDGVSIGRVANNSRFTVTFDISNGKCFIGSTSVDVPINGLSYFSSSDVVYLFGGYQNSLGTISCVNMIPAKMYSCQISESGKLSRDFVPCKNPSGEVGLYDKVSKTFFANKGTGAFTAGPAV